MLVDSLRLRLVVTYACLSSKLRCYIVTLLHCYVLDVVGVLNDQDDYTKNRNYWKYLKTKLKKEENELVSVTNQLKLLAPDGKRRLTDIP